MSKEIQRKRQIDVGRAYILRRAGLTYAEIGEALGGYSASGVCGALQGFMESLPNPGVIRAYQDNQVEIVDGISAQISSLLSSKLASKKIQEQLTPYQLMGMYGISFDKSRLLKGQSTVNLNSLSALVVGAAADFAKGRSPNVSRDTNAVLEPESEPIEVETAPNKIKPENTDDNTGS